MDVDTGSAAPGQAGAAAANAAVRRELPQWLLGVVGLGLSLLGVLAVVIAFAIASPASATEQTWLIARVLAGVANVMTVVGALSGLVAIVLGMGRRWGVAALIVGILGNPWLQVTVLSALS
ncbi:hypothetical protein [Homoserinimonas hongtaonis]|uniref:Major facilitator superfamily (MFS) profile domain-containing protein n=1 Tax=Homoserinimonas hongtaonis TaxID=2079791 RepID=A0A2U1T2D8_9MICO|nr:hypothetical protein [Salinibacterium hongtaonis]AWB88261.1 hypothetical protein C2138_00690 [Salinibacterium hongtaonis]PWB98010.1 hypothetical protein DF220_09345 [Salinibacterium hongtaonis]